MLLLIGLLGLIAYLWLKRPTKIIGIFHPFCDSGGGGERVLWTAIGALQQEYPDWTIVIYTWSGAASLSTILTKVEHQFQISINPHNLKLVHLHTYQLLEAYNYPRFTLLGQSIGSMITGLESLLKYRPTWFIDTIGFAFVYPIAKLFGCKVIAYVHYPTISTDMISKVETRTSDFNNDDRIAKNQHLSQVKLIYYQLFAKLYGLVGRCCDQVMVNSTWTLNHINQLWQIPNKTRIVYPPCDTKGMCLFPLDNRKKCIVSVGQFRPEKNHGLQLRAFKRLLQVYPQYNHVELIIVGSSRNEEDEQRARELEVLADELDLLHSVKVIKNAAYSDLLKYLATSLIGIHTMKDEHFGIGIIEFMASGLIAVVHDSGGPKLDIVTDKVNGYRAQTELEYAEALHQALSLSNEDRLLLCESARRQVSLKYSEARFNEQFNETIKTIN